jgi:hypothetical protein
MLPQKILLLLVNALHELLGLLTQLDLIIDSLGLNPQLERLLISAGHGWLSVLAPLCLLRSHKAALFSNTRNILLVFDYF